MNSKFPPKVLTRSPASLLWRFINILPSSLEPRRWFLSLSRVSTKYLANLYPYSMLSPHPPQIQSRAISLGRLALLHPHLLSSPSLHERLTECMTPADDTAWVKAASLLAEKKMEGVWIVLSYNWICNYVKHQIKGGFFLQMHSSFNVSTRQ